MHAYIRLRSIDDALIGVLCGRSAVNRRVSIHSDIIMPACIYDADLGRIISAYDYLDL